MDKVICTVVGPAIEVGGGQLAAAFAEAVGKASSMTTRYEGHATSPVGYAQLHLGEAQIAFYATTNLPDIIGGVHEDLGKVPVRNVWNSYPIPLILMARGDSGINTPADLKGTKAATVPGTSFFSEAVEAYLAFAGLTNDDVTWVTMPSPPAAIGGVLEGSVDTALTSVPSDAPQLELAESMSGITYIELSPDDVEGWKRFREGRGYYGPATLEGAAGVEEGEVLNGYGMSRGFLSTPKHSPEVIYEFCRALKDGYETYSRDVPMLEDNTWERGYSLDGLMPSVPYHEGTVQFFKDQGVWSPEHEKFQQEALRLQAEILAE